MDCKYVRESNCIAYKFHPSGSSIFLLTHFKNRLRILQENLLTGLVMNQFIVPLKQQNLNVQNYILNFSQQLKIIILTLYNHLLIYSLEKKTLQFVTELHGKNPYYIEKAFVYQKSLYFTAIDQHNIYSINLQQTLENHKINNYNKYKIPQEIVIIEFYVSSNKVVGIGNDRTLKVWDVNTFNLLKSTSIVNYGNFVCMDLSKQERYLLIGTSDGYVLGFDWPKLGIQTKMILEQRILKSPIHSISWFHYSGEEQSKRFLIMNEQGSVKLYSFFLQSTEKHYMKVAMGKTNELALLYECKVQISKDYKISSHRFANFIFFNPGILLYMIDNYPRIYYPVIAKQALSSFDQLIPNDKKQVFFQRDYLFMENLQIKRILSEIEMKINLKNILSYEDLKIIKLDYRPQTKQLVNKYKILITYYLKDSVRSILLNKIDLSLQQDHIQSMKQFLGLSTMFIGPVTSASPLILNLQNDRQTISITQQEQLPKEQLQKSDFEQRKMLSEGVKNLQPIKLKIKVQKIFQTPFRNNYVILYLTENLLRFSKNIDCQYSILDYEVYPELSLRLEYYDIIIDVIWTKQAEFAAIVCLDKIVFISPDLKIIKTVNIQYIIQAQFVGYTLIVTTKVDVQYVNICTKPVQLYCIENFESKYLILSILCDRVLSVQRFERTYNLKSRYFNLMQPLISGYLGYHKVFDQPIDSNKCKKIIQCFSPYHIVSESFLKQLNDMKLTSFSKYLIETNIKLYSKSIRANTFNSSLKMQRFIDQKIWNQNKNQILELFLAFQQTSDTTNVFQKQNNEQTKQKIISIISQISLNSILQARKQQYSKSTIMISNNFGEKSLTQIYYDIKQGEKVTMQIVPFKAENIGEWIGLFSGYIQAKTGAADGNAVIRNDINQENHEEDEQQKPFKDLIMYYRFDQGKGQSIEDLGDYGNNGDMQGQWIQLQDEPMELEDKWGKKCPPQYSIKGFIKRQKALSCRKFQSFTIQTWFKFGQLHFQMYKIGTGFDLRFSDNNFILNGKPLKYKNETVPDKNNWNHICTCYYAETKKLEILINTQLSISVSIPIMITKDSPEIGDPQNLIEFTQFRYWKKIVELNDLKDCMRSPLELVYEKRKRLKMKIKKKKKQQIQTQNNSAGDFFNFAL